VTTLPPPRQSGRYAIALVCLGNICRSPMAHVVLEESLRDAGLSDRVTVASSGTGDWHIGDPMDRRAATALAGAGYDPSRHRARQYDDSWLDAHDLVLAMDEQNLDDLGGGSERVRLFREFDPEGPGEVPDPYYGSRDGFAEVLAIAERTSASLVSALSETLA
jgi:protein-tyrosine phosphatase